MKKKKKRPREAQGGPGRPRKAQGGPGRPREEQGEGGVVGFGAPKWGGAFRRPKEVLQGRAVSAPEIPHRV